MDFARRRALRWLVVPMVAALAAIGLTVTPASAQQNTLRGAAGNMLIGAAVTPNLLNNSTYANLARTHFSSVTAENHMKWDTLQPSQGNFNFGPANQIVQFAQQNNQNVYGHTLVWHSQTPSWVQNLNGTAMLSAMRTHIDTVVRQFGNNVSQWDVVNEVIGDNAQLRNSFWLNGIGQSYIAEAFRAARAANPNARLCMNDYSIDGINAKSNAYFNLAQQLLQQGVPIDCMGFQAHLIVGQVPGDMQQNLQRFRNLGLEIWVTELDIRIPRPVSQQNLQQQATNYAQVADICQAAGCRGLTIWGIHDAQSWVDSTFPEYDAPLLWDDNFNAKPAFNSFLQALGGTTNPPPPGPQPPPPGPQPPPPGPQPPPPGPQPPPPAGSCQVAYSASNWGGSPGFTASVTIRNTSSATVNGWTVGWSYSAGQTVTPPGWNATISQSGSNVTAANASYNGTIPPNGTANFGFNGNAASTGNNPSPSGFTLNGTSCSTG